MSTNGSPFSSVLALKTARSSSELAATGPKNARMSAYGANGAIADSLLQPEPPRVARYQIAIDADSASPTALLRG
jgi:hypothetical protein